jgi:hypothetical protein
MPNQSSGTGFCKVMQTGGEEEKTFGIIKSARAELTLTIYVRASCWRASVTGAAAAPSRLWIEFHFKPPFSTRCGTVA